MTLPIVGQEYPSQIRMPVKDNAEQIEGFTLVPICGAPYTRYRWHMRILFG